MPDKAGAKVTATQSFLNGYYYWDEVSDPREYVQEGGAYKFIERTSGTGDYELIDAADTQVYRTASVFGVEPNNATYVAGGSGSGSFSVVASPKLESTISPSSVLTNSTLSADINLAATITPWTEWDGTQYVPMAEDFLSVQDSQGSLNSLYYIAGTYNGYLLYESARLTQSPNGGDVPEYSLLWSIGDTDSNGYSNDPYIGVDPGPPLRTRDALEAGWRFCQNPVVIGQYYAPPEAKGLGNADPTLATWTPLTGSITRVISVGGLGRCFANLVTTLPTELGAVANCYTSIEPNLTKYTWNNISSDCDGKTTFTIQEMEIVRAITGQLYGKTTITPYCTVSRPIKTAIYPKTSINAQISVNPVTIESKISSFSSPSGSISCQPCMISGSIKTGSSSSGTIAVFAVLGADEPGEVEIFEASKPGATIQQTRQNWVKSVGLQNGDAQVSITWNEGNPPSINE